MGREELRFRSFSERVLSIRVDVAHRSRRRPIGKLADDETYFKEVLEKWTELNCTQDFAQLVDLIGPDVNTVAELILAKDGIFKLLLHQLSQKDCRCLEANLELVVALARDLQQDFYPQFASFFEVITNTHLQERSAEVIEQVFTCLADLFQFQWRFMVEDIERVFELYQPLLSENSKDYIKAFAAESFAFLMRKVRDKPALLNLVFNRADEDESFARGFGVLLFEMLKGVKTRLHSCSEDVFPLILRRLAHKGESTEARLTIVRTMLEMLCNHVASDSTDFVWESLKDALLTSQPLSASHFAAVCQCYGEVVSFKNGKLIRDPDDICLTIEKSFKNCPEEAFPHFLDTLAVVLSTCEARGASEESLTGVIDAFVASEQNVREDALAEMLERLSKLLCFPKSVVPRFWKYCERLEVNLAFHLLTKLESLAAAKILCGSDLDHWRPLACLDNLSESPLIPAIKKGLRLTRHTPKENHDLERFWESCILVRHLRGFCFEDFAVPELRNALKSLLAIPVTEMAELTLVCVQECVRSLVALKEKVDPRDLLPTLKFFKKPSVLRSMDLALHSVGRMKKAALKQDLLEELWWQLASPYAVMRFLTLRILSHFEPPEADVPKGKIAVFRYMLNLESVAVTVQEFKNRANLMEKLRFETVLKCSIEPSMSRCTLAFLFGQLYINFSQLWPTVRKLIASYSEYDKFWRILDQHLEATTNVILGVTTGDDDIVDELLDNATLREVVNVRETYENTDYELHRVFLWNIVELIENSAVVSVVPRRHFLELYDKEFRPRSEFIVSENVIRNMEETDVTMEVDEPMEEQSNAVKIDDEGAIIIDEDSDDDGEDFDRENSIGNNEELPRKKSKATKYGAIAGQPKKRLGATKNPRNCLAAALTALSKSDLKRIPDREVLETCFTDLLMLPDAAIQRLALECLLACGKKILLGHRENLMKLLDDKEWMGVLNDCFLANRAVESASENNQKDISAPEAKKRRSSQHSLSEKERKKILPFVMRLLFGRMRTKKTGHRSKSRVVSKHAAVLRFLASSRESDLLYFIELILLPLKRFMAIELETKATAELLQAVTFDPESAMPVKRLRLVLTDIANVLKHMAGVLPNFLPLLFRAVLLVLQYSNLVDNRSAEVNRLYSESMKRIRMRSVDIVHIYFRDLDHYAIDIEDIHLFFDAYMWPLLQESIRISNAVTARVYRLVSCFASKERLQFLLALRNRKNITRTIMSELMIILESPSTDEKISKQIKNTVRHLLSDVQPGSRAAPISHDVEEVELSDVPGASLGLRIVLPYTFILLSRAFTQIEKTKKPLDPLDRFILYKLSEFNADPTLSSHMLSVIVPSFFNSRKTQERGEDRTQFETLTIIKNVIAHADSVEAVYPMLCRLWSFVTDRSGRNVLVEIFEALTNRVPGVNQAICEIAKSVNSWDSRLAEEPDYLRRIKGFRELVNLIEMMKVPEVNSALPLIHNCLYASLDSDDLSLRDASTFALTKIITFCHDLLGEGHEEFFRTCVEQEIYTGIKKGLRSVKETTRHESVKLLSHVLSSCDDRKLFEELKSFQDPEREKDFFECIIHIQVHRRARALTRLSQMLSKRSVSHRVVKEIFLPLTESFLLKDEYSKQNIAEAAVENLGALARKLPWRTYARLLEKYIDLLGNKELCAVKARQKLVVKIVVTILEAFHFDLSQMVTMFEENMTSLSYGKMSMKDKMTLPTPDVPISLETEMGLNDEGEEQLSALPMEQTSDLPPDGTITVVDVKVGREILVTLKDLLLKRLQTAIVRKSYYGQENDEDSEENDVLRVPIAVAIIKLLSLLPSKVFLRKNLPSVLLKVIVFLKSRLLPVRETARTALVKIVQILGPCYLKYMIREMRSLLTRGFQLHVLSYTVHAVLEAVRPQMQNGDLDECVEDLLEICMQEQFGIVSDEKDVAGITAKTDEAKKSKSVDMFRIVAAVVSDEQLQTVLDTLEKKLLGGNNAKIVTKCEKILDAIGQGLETNKGLSKARVLIFCYKLLNENTARLLVTDPVLAKELEAENEQDPEIVGGNILPYEKPDVFLVPKTPARGASTAIVSVRANVHVLIGTALKVLRDLLRKNRGAEMSKMLHMLNPFVEPLCKLQRCSYVDVVTEVMVVLQQMLHYPLPAFEGNLHLIVKTSMNIIHKYLGTTQKAGNNYQMLIAAFKTVRCVLEEVRDVQFTEEQYKMLLTYVESDICDVERQIVAFALLGSIIGKGINLPELHRLMKKVADMSIQEPVTAIRNQARTVYQKYLFDYPIEPKLREKCVSFYLGQLEYAVEDGRRSAAEMVYQIIKQYPEPILIRHSLLFFVPLAASLVNDSSVTMKKMTYGCLTSLLNKLDVNTRTSLYSLTKKWLQDVSKVQKQCLGAQVIGCFADVEKENFASRVDDCLGIVVQFLAPKEPDDEAEVDHKEEHLNDRLLYLLLNSIVKILTHVNVFESPKQAELVRRIMDHCRAYILHPHSWVRTASAQIFGLLFAQHQPKSIACSLGQASNWLSAGGRELLDELILNFFEQFESRQVPLDLLDQLTKNLLFVAKVLLYLEISDLPDNGSDESNAVRGHSSHRTFPWFVYKIERELRDLGNERTPNSDKRTCLYKVLAALSLECPRDVLQHYHQNFLGPVVRDLESNNQNRDASFRQLVKEVSQVLRKQMGFDFYQEKYASQLTDRARLKARMKQRRAVERMLDPELDLEHREKKRKAERANKKLKRRQAAPVNPS